MGTSKSERVIFRLPDLRRREVLLPYQGQMVVLTVDRLRLGQQVEEVVGRLVAVPQTAFGPVVTLAVLRTRQNEVAYSSATIRRIELLADRILETVRDE